MAGLDRQSAALGPRPRVDRSCDAAARDRRLRRRQLGTACARARPAAGAAGGAHQRSGQPEPALRPLCRRARTRRAAFGHGSWADLAAFARGGARLALVLRDRRGNAVDRRDIDPALFARGMARAVAVLEASNATAADFRRQCRHVDDVDPQVVVT